MEWGSTKLKKYGSVFLDIIREYSEENDIQMREEAIEKKVAKTASKQKHELVGEEYSSGKSIDHLAEQFGVKSVTILFKSEEIS